MDVGGYLHQPFSITDTYISCVPIQDEYNETLHIFY